MGDNWWKMGFTASQASSYGGLLSQSEVCLFKYNLFCKFVFLLIMYLYIIFFHVDFTMIQNLTIKMRKWLLVCFKLLRECIPIFQQDWRLIKKIEKFKHAEGMFGMNMAILTRDKKQPNIVIYNCKYLI